MDWSRSVVHAAVLSIDYYFFTIRVSDESQQATANRGHRTWLAWVVRLAVVPLVILAGIWFVTGMPGRSWTGPLPPLTDREHEVLTLVSEGLTNKAMAAQLEISENTVKYHVNSILSKLGAQSRTEAVVTAARSGLLPL